jgi:hypothetical protein
LIAGSSFGNRPIAVKERAVSDPCPAVVKGMVTVLAGLAKFERS